LVTNGNIEKESSSSEKYSSDKNRPSFNPDDDE